MVGWRAGPTSERGGGGKGGGGGECPPSHHHQDFENNGQSPRRNQTPLPMTEDRPKPGCPRTVCLSARTGFENTRTTSQKTHSPASPSLFRLHRSIQQHGPPVAEFVSDPHSLPITPPGCFCPGMRARREPLCGGRQRGRRSAQMHVRNEKRGKCSLAVSRSSADSLA